MCMLIARPPALQAAQQEPNSLCVAGAANLQHTQGTALRNIAPIPNALVNIQVPTDALHFLRGAASTQPALMQGLAEYMPHVFHRY